MYARGNTVVSVPGHLVIAAIYILMLIYLRPRVSEMLRRF